MAQSRAATAEALFSALRENHAFPENLRQTLTIDEAYLVQMALLDQQCGNGETHTGWKVGLTSKAMQAQQNVHEPCLGHLLHSGHLQSPAHLDFASLMSPGFENELCLRIGAPLRGIVTFEQAAAAIDAVAPAIEVIEKRGVFGADFPLAIAGNAQQRAFVTGPFKAFNGDLAEVSLDLRVNGTSQGHSTGAAVLGNPIHSLVWLASKLDQFDRSLRPGDLVMSGSFTKQYAASAADHVVVDFQGIGSAELTFG